MADEIEIMKNERAAAPDGAEWMTGPPAGVQVDDFVCGLQRGGVKLWIDNDGLFLGHAGVVVCIDHHELCVIAHGDAILAPHDDRDPLGLVDPGIILTRDLVALITEAVRLGDRQWAHLLRACKEHGVAEADARADEVSVACNAAIADVRKVIGAAPGEGVYDAIRAFAGSAKAKRWAIAEFANMLGCGEGEIGDHLRRIISAVEGCSAGTVAAKVEELRNALLVVERSESKRHAELASAARLLSDAGFSGATLEDRVKAVLRERASLEAENAELVAEINELKRVSSARAAKVREALENNVGSPARAVLLAGIALYEPIGGAP